MCAGGELLAVGQRDAVLDAGGMGEPPAGDGDLQARSHTEREQRAMARVEVAHGAQYVDARVRQSQQVAETQR